MKSSNLVALLLALAPAGALAGANCATSQSWQCQHHSSTTSGGSGPNPGTTIGTTLPPTGTTAPLGSVPTDHHDVMLVPLQPPPQLKPKPLVVAIPPQVLPPQQVPALVPPQPTQQTPTQVAVAVPPHVPPPQTPTHITQQPPPQQTPSQSTVAIPPKPRPQRADIPAILVQAPSSAGNGKTPVQTGSATHQLAVHDPQRQLPVTSGQHDGRSPYSLEFIEPGIQNHKVEVYRSKDVQERLYRDTIPLDAGGFHLIVLGIRNPAYSR